MDEWVNFHYGPRVWEEGQGHWAGGESETWGRSHRLRATLWPGGGRGHSQACLALWQARFWWPPGLSCTPPSGDPILHSPGLRMR